MRPTDHAAPTLTARLTATFMTIAALTAAAHAEPLNPLNFAPLAGGAAVTFPGSALVIDTDAVVIRHYLAGGVGATIYTGELSPDGQIAVFAFNRLTFAGNITVVGKRGLAVLSQTDITGVISINANGGAGGGGNSNQGGLGGSSPTSAVGNGGVGIGGRGGFTTYPSVIQGEGVGVPGSGIGGGIGPTTPGVPATVPSGGGSFGGAASGTGAGITYGNLLYRLEGGSGGSGGTGAGTAVGGGGGGGGGAGGGAIELGAIGAVSLSGSGSILANGGAGGAGANANCGKGGAGSGGGVLIHATTVTLPASISAAGGTNGVNTAGGGRIAILSTNDPGSAGLGVGNGTITSLRTGLTSTNIDFGDVLVGTTRRLPMIVTSTGAAATSINGRFPSATTPFTCQSATGIFSAIHGGDSAVASYVFTPQSTGTFSATLTIVSDAGNIDVTLTGRGVTPPTPVCVADLGIQGGLPGHDGSLDNNDFIVFVNAFFNNTGCP